MTSEAESEFCQYKYCFRGGQIEFPLFFFNDSIHANLYKLYNADVLSIDNVYFKGFRYGLYLRKINENV
jgi:hypothetical protein